MPANTRAFPLRLGFRLISGLPQAAALAIVAARTLAADGTRSVPATLPFLSLDDLCRRAGLSRAVVKRLAEADAFGSLAQDRRAALWQALGQDKRPRPAPLFDLLAPDEEPPAELPAMSLEEQVFADYRTAGLSLKAHPMSFQRARLDALGVLQAENLASAANDRYVRVAGLVILRQRPSTAKGITFVTLEDETGTINLVVKQHIWDRYYEVARRSPAWLAHGKLERRESVVHVLVQRLEDLAARLGGLSIKSRDFR